MEQPDPIPELPVFESFLEGLFQSPLVDGLLISFDEPDDSPQPREPATLKVCENCGITVVQSRPICPNCRGYHFDLAP